MKLFTKKRIVLFLLFIFPLICFLILSKGENNFKKLPILTSNISNTVFQEKLLSLDNKVTILCFIGKDLDKIKTGLFNFNEKIYKKFIDYNDFQVVAIYSSEVEKDVFDFKERLGKYTDMKKWNFIELEDNELLKFHKNLSVKDTLDNLGISKAYILDKNLNLRGRLNDSDYKDGKLESYNLNSVSELKTKMKDDINVLFYEYYAAFKNRNKNKADRKEVGL